MIKLDINNPIVEDNGDVIIGKLTSGKDIIVSKRDYEGFMNEVNAEIIRFSALRLDGKVDLNKYAEYVLAREIERLVCDYEF